MSQKSWDTLSKPAAPTSVPGLLRHILSLCCRHPANWPRGNIIVPSFLRTPQLLQLSVHDLIVVAVAAAVRSSYARLFGSSKTFLRSLKVKLRARRVGPSSALLSGSPPRPSRRRAASRRRREDQRINLWREGVSEAAAVCVAAAAMAVAAVVLGQPMYVSNSDFHFAPRYVSISPGSFLLSGNLAAKAAHVQKRRRYIGLTSSFIHLCCPFSRKSPQSHVTSKPIK